MTNEVTTVTTERSVQPRTSAIGQLAARLGVEAGDLFMRSLKGVAFRSPDVTNEQLMALVVVANQYKLNPFTKELYAFPDPRSGGIVPIVSVDGWYRIINEHPQMDGLEYVEGHDETRGRYGECTIYRKDRGHPTRIREWMTEVNRNTDTWRTYGSRMLRHKTIIQCSRVAFGFAGIFEPDEADRILQAREASIGATTVTGTGAAKLAAVLGPPLTEPNVASIDVPVPASAALLGDDEEARALAADAARLIDGGKEVSDDR